MSEADEIEDITNAAGTGAVDFPNGLNIAGSNSGIVGAKHTVSETAPSTPSNGDTWYDDNASIYYVRINNDWKAWLGSPPVYASTFTKGQVIDHEDLENASGFTSFHSQSQFNNDGTKWFVATLDTNQYDVLFEEWDLSTAYDLSTATYSQSVFRDILVEQGGVRAMTFNDDGTELLIWCRTPAGSSPRARAYTFTLSTAYDISTLSGVPSTYVSTAGAGVFDGSAGGNGRSYTWTPDGSVLYASEHTSRVCKVEVGTSFDLTDITTSEQLESDDMGITETGTYVSVPAYGVGFRNNGKLCYILQGSTDSILHETLLSTPYDITTGTLLSSINLGDPPYSFQTTQNILMAPDSIIIYGSLGTNNGGYKYTYVNVTSSISLSFTWGGDRALVAGGQDPWASPVKINNIDYFSIPTTGNAQDFGDLTTSRTAIGSMSSTSRSVFGGGFTGSSGSSHTNVMDYVTTSTAANAIDFGDMVNSQAYRAGCSDGSRGLLIGGQVSPLNAIDYITISTTGNATDFGDTNKSTGRRAACADLTRGVVAGGNATGQSMNSDNIEYVNIAITGNANTFGTISPSGVYSKQASFSDSTYGVWAGGIVGSTTDIIFYVTIQTTGTTSDFGDLTLARSAAAGSSNGTRGVISGGYDASTYTHSNIIDYVTIATPSNAVDFGDLAQKRTETVGASGNAA